MTQKRSYQIKINEHVYLVELDDLAARPVIAMVDGNRFEIWPEDASTQQEPPGAPDKGATSGEELDVPDVMAPMPGTIVAVNTHPGAQVKYGDELCVLEAMKMKNSIRSPRSGTINQVLVTSGQTVKYRDVLIRFEE